MMPQGARGRSSSAIKVFLEGVSFPASKDELIAHSEDEHAPQEIIDLLEGLPDRDYDDLSDVMLGVAQVE